jgi:hypothetical protein
LHIFPRNAEARAGRAGGRVEEVTDWRKEKEVEKRKKEKKSLPRNTVLESWRRCYLRDTASVREGEWQEMYRERKWETERGRLRLKQSKSKQCL